MSAVGLEHSLDRYVVRWALYAGVATTCAVATWGLPARVSAHGPWILAPALAAVYTLLQLVEVHLPLTAEDKGSATLEEVVVAAALVLLSGAWIVPTLVAADVVKDLAVRRRPVRKAVFNASWTSVALTAALTTFHLLTETPAIDAATAVAAMVAVAAYAAVNEAAMSGIQSRFQGTPWCQVFRRNLPTTGLTAVATASIGAVAVLLLPYGVGALPLLVGALALVGARWVDHSGSRRSLIAEHDKLRRTVDGASDGIALLSPHGRVEVWNPALTTMTRVEPGEAIGRPIGDVLPALASAATDPVEDDPELVLGSHFVRIRRRELPARGGVVLVARDVTREAELDLLREDLVSRVSHELRTPLQSVTGFLEVLADRWEALGDAERLVLLDRARSGAARLNRLVGALLTRSRIERSITRPDPCPVDVRDALEELVVSLEEAVPIAPSRTVTGDCVAWVDPDHLAQVLTNLLVNAVKYGAPPYEVYASSEGAHVLIGVRDHGAGVPPEFEDDLFTPFAQASTGIRRVARGLGLGLSIVRELTEANGGSVEHVVPEDGVGAAFVVTLPRAAVGVSSVTGRGGRSTGARAPHPAA